MAIIIYNNNMAHQDISKYIRERRLKLGLSLSGLAKRINTSTATLSRYENGWQRFELYTLRKIATALGCKLEVKFIPVSSNEIYKKSLNSFVKLQRLFWDRPLQKKDIHDYPLWVTERVLDYGDLEDVHTLIRLFGRKAFLANVAKCKFKSPKTTGFWNYVLNKEDIPCMKRPFQREVWQS